MSWYTINGIEKIDSPSLVVYPQRVRENIRLAIAMAGGASRLRPHVKTNKTAEVCLMMLEAGIDTFKCATIAEAEMLGIIHAADVLLAHQPVGPKAERLLQLTKKFPDTQFSCIIDNLLTAQELSALFDKENKTLSVFIDLNIGMNRSGIVPEKAFGLFTQCRSLPGIRLIGLHGYDGHIRNSDPVERQAASDNGFGRVDRLANALTEAYGISLQIVAGGSPSFPTHIARKNVQLSPGTFVFWDWGYKHQFPDQPFDYAALVITRVVSVIDEETVCLDLGHKAVAAENPLPRVHFLNEPDAVPVSQSEEHLVVKLPRNNTWKPGDVWFGVPVHICPTVALYETALVAEDNRIQGSWKVIARTRKISV
ncbi:D-TA family PLP-dependent enzyme [Sediminibacterium soli]|uniref:D-TA family PLP-dependent enzyme n=1 Tax=Sediminibacterium soli TaxID=2698829 RepID=UPI00137B36B5|nr:D-TA family PLP-dependent enzyme [Sediminibacterium soli]NCI47303.1 D-TA family PLP-dependent enzyme [Sediminibacterium soli]